MISDNDGTSSLLEPVEILFPVTRDYGKPRHLNININYL
jgi:hypothetical protein